MRHHELEKLEPRTMLSAAVETVVIDGVKYKGYGDEDHGERMLIPVKPQIMKPAAQKKAALQAMALSNASLGSGFLITLNLTGAGLTDSIRSAFTAAQTKWQSIITGSSFSPNAVHNVTINASIAPIDGVGKILGQAGPTALASSTFMPTTGVMQFDSADLSNLASSGGLGDVIFHEMGHVLGSGTIWSHKKLKTSSTTDPRYVGTNAIAAYKALGGKDATIPLENLGGAGTAGAHWRESIFSNEIMTGFLNSGVNPVSTITIASMMDLGYTVDASKADPYNIPGVIPPTATATITGKLYTDTNQNGTFDSGEPAVVGKSVYIDANGNNKFDAGERAAASGADGTYVIPNLQPGTYAVKANVTGTIIQTTSMQWVTLESGQTASGIAIGIFNSAANVSGVVFFDKNNNGTRDVGELPAAKVAVYVDANGNSKFDTGERAVSSGADGSYSFLGLAAGSHSIRLILAATTTQSSGVSVTLTAGETLSTNNLGAFDTLTSVSGTIYSDANNNGTRDSGEAPLAARTAFLDLNNNSVADVGERTAITTAQGTYLFTGVAPGTYKVRVVVAAASSLIATTTDTTVTLAAGAAVTGVDRGVYDTAGSISGVVFNDLDKDGTKDSGDTAVAARVVYLDANGNSLFDKGERSVLTSASGAYTFAGVKPGTYSVKVLPALVGFVQTTTNSVTVATAQAVTGADLGSFDTTATIGGTVYNDASNNGTRDSGELGLAARTVYIDVNNNSKLDAGERTAVTSALGAYVFSRVTAGTYNVRVSLAADSTLSPTTSSVSVTVAEGAGTSTADRGLYDTAGSITGTVFNDLSQNGTADSGEAPLAGRTVFIDANANGLFDKGERFAVTNTSGAYTFTAIKPATYALKVVPAIAGMIQTSTNSVTVGTAQAVTGVSVGSFDTNATVSGVLFNDPNNNGTKDSGELGLAKTTVYVDANANGKLDTGERSAVTATDGSYSITLVRPGNVTVRTLLGANISQSTSGALTLDPGQKKTTFDLGAFNANTTLSGSAFLDLNKNGTKDSNELPAKAAVVYLDTNNNGLRETTEPFTTTGLDGSYSFTNRLAGTYNMRIVVPTGFTQILPASNAAKVVTVAAGATSAGNTFALFNTTGTITGTAFFDANKNGTRESTEPVVKNLVAYLDADNDGILDTGERFVLTTVAGAYAFTAVPEGNYTLRIKVPTGLVQTLPAASAAQSITVTPASTTTATPFAVALGAALKAPANLFSETPVG